jgi:hypothetical protein
MAACVSAKARSLTGSEEVKLGGNIEASFQQAGFVERLTAVVQHMTRAINDSS